jgi:hypothetical protein
MIEGRTGQQIIFPDSTQLVENHHHAIREELDRIVASSVFKNSKRYPVFFRYVVERTLSGQSEALKERRLGIRYSGEPSTTTLTPIQS